MTGEGREATPRMFAAVVAGYVQSEREGAPEGFVKRSCCTLGAACNHGAVVEMTGLSVSTRR
jgi:hypothetical protein